MIAPFEASRLKINRAKRHIEDLGREIKAYLDSEPLAIMVEDWTAWHERGAMHAWTARIKRPVPTEFAGLVGDAVHNLRTALDVLACDLVRLNDGNTKSVYFPFCDAPNEIPHKIRDRNMHRAGPKVVKILEGLALYPGANSPLRTLHDLDVMDKHQALIPSLAAVSIPAFFYHTRGIANAVPEWKSSVVHDGQQLIIMPAVSNVEIGSRIDAVTALIFEKLFKYQSIIDMREVFPSLMNLAKVVQRLFDDFVALYPDVSTKSALRLPHPATGAKTLIIGHTDKYIPRR